VESPDGGSSKIKRIKNDKELNAKYDGSEMLNSHKKNRMALYSNFRSFYRRNIITTYSVIDFLVKNEWEFIAA